MKLLDAIGVCEGLAGGTSEARNIVYESTMDSGPAGAASVGDNFT